MQSYTISLLSSESRLRASEGSGSHLNTNKNRIHVNGILAIVRLQFLETLFVIMQNVGLKKQKLPNWVKSISVKGGDFIHQP